jgi:hypothetical protein
VARPRPGLRWLFAGVGKFLILPLFLLAGPVLAAIAFGVDTAKVFYDLKGGLLDAGTAILNGHSPYQPAFLAHQAAIMRSGRIALGETSQHPFSIPVYPAFANVIVVPLSLLPAGVAEGIYTLLSIAAMGGAVWLLGVRDWRCYALVAVSWPFLYGVYLGAIGPFLVLGAAVAWRWRDRLWPPALGVASIIAVKIFPWTLAVWLFVTGRRRAFLLCAGACLALTIGAWALIGFHGLLQYPKMLSEMSSLQEGRADSIVTGLLVAGVSPAVATAVALLLTAGLLGLAWRVARHGGEDGDRRAFGLMIIAAFTGTPIVWEHYMVLIFIPIAMVSPRASRLWLAPVVLPVLELLSPQIIPDSNRLQAYSPDALRGVLPWLAFELLLTVWLTTTPAQRRGWVAAVRRRVPGVRSGAPGASSLELA